MQNYKEYLDYHSVLWRRLDAFIHTYRQTDRQGSRRNVKPKCNNNNNNNNNSNNNNSNNNNSNSNNNNNKNKLFKKPTNYIV